MTTDTRQERRAAERKLSERAQYYYDWFVGLFHNSLKFEDYDENVDNAAPKRYLLHTLAQKGSIAYDKKTGLYLPYVSSQIDVYGLPTKYNLIGKNGFSVWRKADDVVILRINDISAPILPYLEDQAEYIASIDSFKRQNMDACRTMTVLEADPAQFLSIVNENNARRVGASFVVKNQSAMKTSQIIANQTGAQWLVNLAQEERVETINETLARLGISTSNTSKRERVQGFEVVAAQGTALDSLYVMTDTFNHDAEVGGLSLRLVPNTALTVETNGVADAFKDGTDNMKSTDETLSMKQTGGNSNDKQ